MALFLSVTELAKELGITARAIRFYESKGLLSPERAGGTRVYTHRERGRLAIILRAKRLGFQLSEIKDYLDLYDAGTAHRDDQLKLLLAGAHKRIDQLERQREDLDITLDELREIERLTVEALQSD